MLQPLNILLLEDDEDDRSFFIEALRKIDAPHTLHIAGDFLDLFVKLKTVRELDLIFLDINLPVMNGLQCLKELKAHKEFKDIPVIVYSTSSYQKDIDDSFDTGAHYYWVKPVSRLNFITALNYIFGINWKTTQPVPARENFLITVSSI